MTGIASRTGTTTSTTRAGTSMATAFRTAVTGTMTATAVADSDQGRRKVGACQACAGSLLMRSTRTMRSAGSRLR